MAGSAPFEVRICVQFEYDGEGQPKAVGCRLLDSPAEATVQPQAAAPSAEVQAGNGAPLAVPQTEAQGERWTLPLRILGLYGDYQQCTVLESLGGILRTIEAPDHVPYDVATELAKLPAMQQQFGKHLKPMKGTVVDGASQPALKLSP